MDKYYIVCEKYENDNTPEFGYGDFPRYTPYIALTVEAETRRKAQNKAKKINSRLGFSGMFGDRIYIDKDLPDYLRRLKDE
mgnify:CR=1 FL=1|tara:strand:+ start:357 stop:599 length:243 start_codon:yes stop_codon:yes gene_type:complete